MAQIRNLGCIALVCGCGLALAAFSKAQDPTQIEVAPSTNSPAPIISGAPPALPGQQAAPTQNEVAPSTNSPAPFVSGAPPALPGQQAQQPAPNQLPGNYPPVNDGQLAPNRRHDCTIDGGSICPHSLQDPFIEMHYRPACQNPHTYIDEYPAFHYGHGYHHHYRFHHHHGW